MFARDAGIPPDDLPDRPPSPAGPAAADGPAVPDDPVLPGAPVVHDETACRHGVLAVTCLDPHCVGALIDLGTDPGARLALQVQVAGEMPGALSRAEVLDAVQGADHLIRWLEGLRIRMLSEFHARHPADRPGATPPAPAQQVTNDVGPVPSQRRVPAEVGIMLELSTHEAAGQLERALRFTDVLPDTLAELEHGRIDVRRANAISRATGPLPTAKAREVEAKVLGKAHDATLRQLQGRLRRAVARTDPDGHYRRHREAHRKRQVSTRALDDGMASLRFYGCAPQIEAAWQMADRLARGLGADDARTLDQRRFDVSMQVLQGRLTVTNQADLSAAVAANTTTGSTGSGGSTGSTGSGEAAGSAAAASNAGCTAAASNAGNASSTAAVSNADRSGSARAPDGARRCRRRPERRPRWQHRRRRQRRR